MLLNYHISLPNGLEIYEFIKDFKYISSIDSKYKKGTTYHYQTAEVCGYYIDIYVSKEDFEELKYEVFNQFSVDLSEYCFMNYQHYHIERYAEKNYDILHSAIAYHVDDHVWGVYYQDGILSNIQHPILEGTLPDEGIFLYNLIMEPNDDSNTVMEKLESQFDNWLIEQKNDIR
ncbi:hypothetical protein GJU40_19985 [Bacillus lacus]|uniref:Uncharacterized protein n=1 Tax=Metabacillus lacus TaxID=1983721 RepID=A0A7X2M1H5_9BACI|nr:hypothetical protein [Metabacillus lacus]MRX74404.1 hypothetical protein [Metabacillus lacus]